VASIGEEDRRGSRGGVDSGCQALTFSSTTFDEYGTSPVCLKADRIFDSLKALARRLVQEARKSCLLKFVDPSRIVSSITSE